MEEIEKLKRQIELEKQAHQQTEIILEKKALELYETSEQLQLLNQNLEQQVKNAVDELKKTEKRYRHLIESVQDIIYKISTDGFFTYVNPVIKERLGFSEDEIIGRHFSTLVLPNYQEALINFYAEMVQNKEESTYNEFPIKAKNGNIVWIGQNVRRIENDDESIELVAVARDITERKITEDTLRATQARFSNFISNLQKGILVEDENHTIILANQLFCDLFNIDLSPSDLIGINCLSLADEIQGHFKDPENFLSRVNEVLEKGKLLLRNNLKWSMEESLKETIFPFLLKDNTEVIYITFRM